MEEQKKIIDLAMSQIGYEEPNHDNHQKYGHDIDTLWPPKEWYNGRKDGFDWCTQFHDWCFLTAFGLEGAKKKLYRKGNNLGAVVSYSYNYYKKAGKTGSVPKNGCSIFFQNSKGLSHIGIVVGFTDTTVTTVEGNSGKGNWFVVKKTYKRSDGYIYGYGYPDYDETPGPEPHKYPSLPFEISVKESGKTGIRDGGWASSKYLGTINKGVYLITNLNNDFGKISNRDAWIYLIDKNIEILGHTVDGYTIGQKYKVVCKDTLNVRTAATTKGLIVTAIKPGTEIICKAITYDEEGNTWLRIDSPVSGWIAAHYHGEYYVK